MKNLWTPWRYKYITDSKSSGCVLCVACSATDDRDSGVLFRGTSNIILLNRYPYSNGHLMIAPIAHISSPENSSDDIVSELTSLMLISLKVLGTVYNPDGINIGMNIGSAAGAGIDDHYHMHIVPRWTGDTNFMSVTAQTRLVPQTLADAWDSLKPVFDKECANVK